MNHNLNEFSEPLFITKVKVIKAEIITQDYIKLSNKEGEELLGLKGDWIIYTSDGDFYIKDKHWMKYNYEPFNNAAFEEMEKLKELEDEKKVTSIEVSYYGTEILENK